MEEEGASGSCYFAVAANDSVDCEGGGGVTMIGANMAELAADAGPSQAPAAIPECTGSFSGAGTRRRIKTLPFATGIRSGTLMWGVYADVRMYDDVVSKGTCKFSAASKGAAAWINIGIDVVPASASARAGPLPNGSVVKMECSAPPPPGPKLSPLLCSYRVNTSIGMFNETSLSNPHHHASSCSFVLPAGDETVTCTWSTTVGTEAAGAGAGPSAAIEVVLHTSSTTLQQSARGELKELDASCPIATYPHTNFCDCTFEHPANATGDALYFIDAVNVNNGYNNFYCYTEVQVAAYGQNSNNQGEGNSIFFIVAPGESLTCTMQYGGLAFDAVRVVETASTMYPRSPATGFEANRPKTPKFTSTGPGGGKGPGGVLPPRDGEVTRQMFRNWMKHHRKQYSTHEEEQLRFSYFQRHASLKRALTQRIVGGDDVSLPAGQRFNGLADLSPGEFERSYRTGYMQNGHADASNAMLPPPLPEGLITAEDVRDTPSSVDWRTKGAVSAVKDQGRCGCVHIMLFGVLYIVAGA